MAQRSARRSTLVARACSGAMHAGLPLMVPGRDALMRDAASAMPKSVRRPMPSSPIEDVLGRDVAMHEVQRGLVVAVQRVSRLEARHRVEQDAVHDADAVMPPDRRTLQDLQQLEAVDVVHDHEVAVVDRADVDRRHHVGVVNARRELGLVEQHADELLVAHQSGGASTLIANRRRKPADADAAREAHDAHTAGRDFGDEFVPAQTAARCGVVHGKRPPYENATLSFETCAEGPAPPPQSVANAPIRIVETPSTAVVAASDIGAKLELRAVVVAVPRGVLLVFVPLIQRVEAGPGEDRAAHDRERRAGPKHRGREPGTRRGRRHVEWNEAHRPLSLQAAGGAEVCAGAGVAGAGSTPGGGAGGASSVTSRAAPGVPSTVRETTGRPDQRPSIACAPGATKSSRLCTGSVAARPPSTVRRQGSLQVTFTFASFGARRESVPSATSFVSRSSG